MDAPPPPPASRTRPLREWLVIAAIVAVAITTAVLLVPCRPWNCPKADGRGHSTAATAPDAMAGTSTAELQATLSDRQPGVDVASDGSEDAEDAEVADPSADEGRMWGDVVFEFTGRTVLPVDPGRASTVELLDRLDEAAGQVARRFNADDSPARGLARINEASRLIEDWLAEALEAMPGLQCAVPANEEGAIQRTGYPDLEVVDTRSGAAAYLDPKLFAQGSTTSSLRTFYFEPKDRTNKILRDAAHHLLLGFEHDGQDGAWKITGWHLVDLSRIRVRLKREFNAANRDLYRSESILRTGRPIDSSE